MTDFNSNTLGYESYNRHGGIWGILYEFLRASAEAILQMVYYYKHT